MANGRNGKSRYQRKMERRKLMNGLTRDSRNGYKSYKKQGR